MTGLAIGLALLAAFFLALASVLQQRAASDIPDKDSLGLGLVTGLLRRPLWLAGFACDAVGFVLSAVALIPGSLLLVQPLLVTTLPFALPLGAALAHRRLSRSNWTWAVVLTVSLAGFVYLGNASAGIDSAPFRDWILPLIVIGGLVAACVAGAAARRGSVRSFLLAVCSGVLFGLGGAVTKPVVNSFREGLGAGVVLVCTRWETYVLIAALGIGAYLQQSSYQAGDLRQSLPAITMLDPVTAVILGVIVLQERLQAHGPAEWTVLAVFTVLMLVATLQLARSTAAVEAAVRGKKVLSGSPAG